MKKQSIPFLLTTYRYGSPRKTTGTLRLGTTRYLPRGIPKSKYATLNYFDLWAPILAPSKKLLQWRKKHPEKFVEWRKKYLNEMSKREPKLVISLLAMIAETSPVAIGCFCEDERTCHRRLLAALVKKARQ